MRALPPVRPALLAGDRVVREGAVERPDNRFPVGLGNEM
jgi:hypothetical protein